MALVIPSWTTNRKSPVPCHAHLQRRLSRGDIACSADVVVLAFWIAMKHGNKAPGLAGFGHLRPIGQDARYASIALVK